MKVVKYRVEDVSVPALEAATGEPNRSLVAGVPDGFVTLAEAAARTGKSVNSLRKQLGRRLVGAEKITTSTGQMWVVPVAELERHYPVAPVRSSLVEEDLRGKVQDLERRLLIAESERRVLEVERDGLREQVDLLAPIVRQLGTGEPPRRRWFRKG